MDPDPERGNQPLKRKKILNISRVVDPDPHPDSMTLWIRIRIGNPDPGSRGKKKKKINYFLVIVYFYNCKVLKSTNC
jgi:hypothetical protein